MATNANKYQQSISTNCNNYQQINANNCIEKGEEDNEQTCFYCIWVYRIYGKISFFYLTATRKIMVVVLGGSYLNNKWSPLLLDSFEFVKEFIVPGLIVYMLTIHPF